jgi:hypothetical protein
MDFDRFEILIQDRNDDEEKKITNFVKKIRNDLIFLGGFGRKGHQ